MYVLTMIKMGYIFMLVLVLSCPIRASNPDDSDDEGVSEQNLRRAEYILRQAHRGADEAVFQLGLERFYRPDGNSLFYKNDRLALTAAAEIFQETQTELQTLEARRNYKHETYQEIWKAVHRGSLEGCSYSDSRKRYLQTTMETEEPGSEGWLRIGLLLETIPEIEKMDKDALEKKELLQITGDNFFHKTKIAIFGATLMEAVNLAEARIRKMECRFLGASATDFYGTALLKSIQDGSRDQKRLSVRVRSLLERVRSPGVAGKALHDFTMMSVQKDLEEMNFYLNPHGPRVANAAAAVGAAAGVD